MNIFSPFLMNLRNKRICKMFSNSQFSQKLKRSRTNLLQLSDVQKSYQGYQAICKQAHQQWGGNYQSILMREGIVPPVPGLVYLPHFVPDQDLISLKSKSEALYSLLIKQYHSKNDSSLQKSYNHNLTAFKSFKLLSILDPTVKRTLVNAQMFQNYGSQGHDLTYFIGNQNIPDFVENLVKKLEEIDQIKQVYIKNKKQKHLDWRLTFNVYKQKNQQQTAFQWHKDIASNGQITSITTVFGEGYFEIKHEDPLNQNVKYKLLLAPGSLVMLTGQSRWKWVHRVLRKMDENSNQLSSESIKRISLVLGCK